MLQQNFSFFHSFVLCFYLFILLPLFCSFCLFHFSFSCFLHLDHCVTCSRTSLLLFLLLRTQGDKRILNKWIMFNKGWSDGGFFLVSSQWWNISDQFRKKVKFGSVLPDYTEYLIYSSSCTHESSVTLKILPSKGSEEWKWGKLWSGRSQRDAIVFHPFLSYFWHNDAPLFLSVWVFSTSLSSLEPSLSLSLLHLPSHIHPLFVMLSSNAIYSKCPVPFPSFSSSSSTCPHFSSLTLVSLLLPSITLSLLRTLSRSNSTHLAYLQNDPLLSFAANEWLIASSNYLNAQQTAEEKKCIQ